MTKKIPFFFLILTLSSNVFAGLVQCDMSRCYKTKDGLWVCPTGACIKVPPSNP